MKFSIDRDVFSDVLAKVQGVCNLRSTLQFASSCLIEVKGKQLTVLGTNMDISIKVTSEAKIFEEGKVLINAKKLFDSVKSLKPGDAMVSYEKSQVLIESAETRMHVVTGSIDDFPELPNMDLPSSVRLSASSLLDLIDKTFFSISTDESRQAFTGAFLVIRENGKIQMVSTDGHRLSNAESEAQSILEFSPEFEKGVIIPRTGLEQIRKILSDGDVEITLAKQNIIIKTPESAISIRLIVGQFPDFTRVIPQHLEHKAIISRSELIEVIKRASVHSPKVGTIRLTMSSNKLEVTAFNSESGDVTDSINCEYVGDGVSAGFNYRYVLDVLNAIDGDKVSLEVVDTESPSVIRDIATSRYDYVVMPMSI